MENIKNEYIVELEKEIIKQQIVGGKLKVFLWPDKPRDISDSDELKLVIAQEKNESFMRNIIEAKGDSPRVYRNTIFFLCPVDTERNYFADLLKRKIAYQQIDNDKTLNLTEDQRKEVRNNVKKAEENLRDALRRLYRLVHVPAKEGVKEIDIGIPTYGEHKGIDQEVYEILRREGEILEKIAPLVIKEKYLKERDHVQLQQLFESMLKTPGERRAINFEVLMDSVKQGVKQGLFGLGDLQNGNAVCRFFRDEPSVSFDGTEVLIKDTICSAQRQMASTITAGPSVAAPESGKPSEELSKTAEAGVSAKVMNELALRFKVPRGKISQIMGIMNFLQSRFQTLEMEIKANDGSLSEEDYSNKIKEALRQLGIDIEETE